LSATVLDQLGRKWTLCLINVFSIISWGLMFFASSTDFNEMYWQIMLARFLIGEKVSTDVKTPLHHVTFNLFAISGVTIGLSSSPAAGNMSNAKTVKLIGSSHSESSFIFLSR
jgi:Sugar (and other) transporter